MKNKVLFALLLALILCGCEHDETKNDTGRFENVYTQRLDDNTIVRLLRDNETNSEYLVVHTGFGTGVTKLETKNERMNDYENETTKKTSQGSEQEV